MEYPSNFCCVLQRLNVDIVGHWELVGQTESLETFDPDWQELFIDYYGLCQVNLFALVVINNFIFF